MRPTLTALSAALVLLTLPPIAAADIVPQIAGGKKAKVGSYGYVVRLETNTDRGRQSFCSGSLIAPRYVITAAHCLAFSDNEYSDRLQNTGLGVRFANLPGAPARRVVRTSYWKDFNPYLMAEKLQADIALLELAEDGPTAPVEVSALTPAMTKKPLMILGYGPRNHKNEEMSKALIAGKTRVRRPAACSYRDKENHFRPFVAGEICTTSKMPKMTAGGCQGDSGGPLLGLGKLVGVTSWSLEANCEVKPKKRETVFARVSFAQEWLRRQTGAALFGLPAIAPKQEEPPVGKTWVKEVDSERIVAKASLPSGEGDKQAQTAIQVTGYEMQIYYRENKTLTGFRPGLGRAQFNIAADGQSASLSAPGQFGLCTATIADDYLVDGLLGVSCPGGQWQATIVAKISVTLKNNNTEEKAVSVPVTSENPEVVIDIPQSLIDLDPKDLQVFLFARFYNEDDNGTSAQFDSKKISLTESNNSTE